jgi:CRP-like cAMP-binding protein
MGLREEVAEFVAKAKPFASIDAAGIEKLAAIAQEASFQPNETIVEQGAAANVLYVVVKGGVRVITDGRDEDHEVARLGAWQFFGEMGILNDEPRAASVRAIGDTRCLTFDKRALLPILEEYPKVLHSLGALGVERAAKLADIEE